VVGRDGAVLELRPGLEWVGTGAAGALPLLVFLPARTELVVLLSLVGITQDLVGLVDLLEPLLRLLVALVDVGVMLARQLAKGAVNLLGGGRSGHTQRRVVVLEGRGHLSRTYRGQSRAKRFAPSARWYSGRARGPECRTAWRRGAIPDHVKHSAPNPMRKLSHIGSAALLALAGATWAASSAGLANANVRAMAFGLDGIAAGTDSGVAVSPDGHIWHGAGLDGDSISAITVAANSPQFTLIAGADNGNIALGYLF